MRAPNQNYAFSWLYCFLEVRPKLRWATNTVSLVQSSQSQKRTLPSGEDQANDREEHLENLPLSKRRNSLVKKMTDEEKEEDVDVPVIRPSVVDDEELDFL